MEKYEVDHYADGISGLEALESGLYDLAVLDVMLPGRDGFEVVREARKRAPHAHTHAVLSVANAGEIIPPEGEKEAV